MKWMQTFHTVNDISNFHGRIFSFLLICFFLHYSVLDFDLQANKTKEETSIYVNDVCQHWWMHKLYLTHTGCIHASVCLGSFCQLWRLVFLISSTFLSLPFSETNQQQVWGDVDTDMAVVVAESGTRSPWDGCKRRTWFIARPQT